MLACQRCLHACVNLALRSPLPKPTKHYFGIMHGNIPSGLVPMHRLLRTSQTRYHSGAVYQWRTNMETANVTHLQLRHQIRGLHGVEGTRADEQNVVRVYITVLRAHDRALHTAGGCKVVKGRGHCAAHLKLETCKTERQGRAEMKSDLVTRKAASTQSHQSPTQEPSIQTSTSSISKSTYCLFLRQP